MTKQVGFIIKLVSFIITKVYWANITVYWHKTYLFSPLYCIIQILILK